MDAVPTLDIRRADTRAHTDLGWLDSRHSFSFGHHHDPTNTGHGLLLVSNDDRVAAGAGFGPHPHRDMEIVTWVLDGALRHRDSQGNDGVIRPGLAQRMSAGTGIRHSEMNDSSSEPVHFVQMWVPPDTTGLTPGYEQRDLGAALDTGELVAVASGRDIDDAVHINQRDATLWVARLDAGAGVTVPAAPWVHLFVARGAVSMAGDRLVGGDAVRLHHHGEIGVTGAGAAGDTSEIIIWEMSTP